LLGAASKDPNKQGFRVLIVACILGRALAPLYYGRRILAGQYGVYRRILLFVYVLVVRFTLLWRPQGELARIPRHITLVAPANHRPSGNCTDPAEPSTSFPHSHIIRWEPAQSRREGNPLHRPGDHDTRKRDRAIFQRCGGSRTTRSVLSRKSARASTIAILGNQPVSTWRKEMSLWFICR
jgi:hypothetical protein